MIGNPSAVKYSLHLNSIEENKITKTTFNDSSVKNLSGKENIYQNSKAESFLVNFPNSKEMSVEGSTTTYSSGGAFGKHLESIVSDSNTLTQAVEMQTKNMKVMQVISDWFESWQAWQRRILLTGLINRFNSSQLRNLLMIVEPVFHKDFVTKLKNVYPIDHSILPFTSEDNKVKSKKTSYVKDKPVPARKKQTATTENNKKTPGVLSDEKQEIDPNSDEITRVPSPAVNPPYKVQRPCTDVSAASSRNLSPIEEGESAKVELDEEGQEVTDNTLIHALLDPHIFHLINEAHSSGMSSNVSTLVSSLSPIEETSTESSLCSIQCEAQLTMPVEAKTIKKSARNENTLRESQLKTPVVAKTIKKSTRNDNKKKSIPETVLKRISRSSSMSERSGISSSPGSSGYLGSHLDFRSNISAMHLETDDFFDHQNEDLLGALVSTRSKMGSEFRSQYDKKRNFAPLPTMQQLYKNEKFWSEKENIVKPEMGRLKEQFSQQLQQIWNWIADWTPSERMKILLQLFSTTTDNTVHYVAQYIRNKFQQMLPEETSPENLPENILLRIFSYVEPYDLSQAKLVCKRWYAILNNEQLWKEKCSYIGKIYGMNDLVELLDKNAAKDETLDWERACTEVYEYLSKNMELVVNLPPDGGSQDEESSSESEEEDPTTNRFKNYVSFLKAFPVKKVKEKIEVQEEIKEDNEEELLDEPNATVERGSSVKKKQKGGFLQMWKNITEDIQNANLEDESGRSDACYDVDLFTEMQTWNDVELFTSLGQRFAVDLHVKDEIDNLQRNSMINSRVTPVRDVQVFKAHQGTVNCVKSHGSRIFSGSVDRQIRCWSLKGECFAKMTGLKGGINDISLPPEDLSHQMFIASWDMSVSVWDCVSFKLLRKLVGHSGSVVRVAADGMYIVSCSHDGSIRVWNRKTYKCECVITCHSGAVQCMVYHDRQIISGGADRTICVTNPANGLLFQTFVGHTSPVTAIKKQHELLASGDTKGFILFWSMTNDQNSPIETLKAHESQINAIIFTEGRFFTASNDALVKEWDLVTMTTLRILQGHTDGVTDVQYTEKYLLTASRDNDVRIWWWRSREDEFEIIE